MRRIRQILIALLLGVITTVAVSWALAMWRTVPMYPKNAASVSIFLKWDHAWHIVTKKMIGVTDAWWMDLSSDDPQGKRPETLVAEGRARHAEQRSSMGILPMFEEAPAWGTFGRGTPPPNGFDAGSDTAFGWPMPCLWYQMIAVSKGNTISGDTIVGGIMIKGAPECRLRNFHALPLRPIWPALAVNIALYSALWSLILFTPGPLRRLHRRRHNRCEQCGYSLAGNDSATTGCPECGWNR